ncbi:type-1 angiotensin II receptor-associated protein-like isoform X1 [Octopus bimaculoides]|uniref:type-1 angiotensin II receptor-associated protein-like isoform X1 n=1 Tax=Octopus bimaculoides TaxID=37653 RepID=UPI00071D66BE|nr:type-1 angiotensin II receptor-associated protein-like isoform X1 [Octopus bimaculoides]|eukprot:XP_014780949.1 PREDICTED: type-1 angiotensin II receptor-associated protein-like isoform X1 [Octopus bimaculoides]
MEPPQVSLKVIVIVHFILTVWASMPTSFLPLSYTYMNAFVLAFGVWGIVNQESTDAISMFLILKIFTIIQDIVFLGIYQPRAYADNGKSSEMSCVHEYRFSLAMSIVNLILKPVSCFLLYRIYQDRGGIYETFSIPGLTSHTGGTYENIDQPVPTNNLEAASPRHMADKLPLDP